MKTIVFYEVPKFPELKFSGWRTLDAQVPPEQVHRFVDIRRACHVGCGQCGFTEDYPVHEKVA